MVMFQTFFTSQEETPQIPSANQMTLMEHLQKIPDFRRKQGLRYPLIAVLLLTIMSISERIITIPASRKKRMPSVSCHHSGGVEGNQF
jgi:hypothetical protein